MFRSGLSWSEHLIRKPLPRFTTETALVDLPLDVMHFLSGSRYMESELMFADALQRIGTHNSSHGRVERICEWVRRYVPYEIGKSLPHGTA